MTGIRERRMWPAGTRPSDASAAAGRAVLAVALTAGTGGAVHPCGRVPRHARARHRLVRAPEDRAPADRADLRCLQRVPRFPQRPDDRRRDDRVRPDPVRAGRIRAKTAGRSWSRRCTRSTTRRRSPATPSNRISPTSPSDRARWVRWCVTGRWRPRAHRLLGGVARAATIQRPLPGGHARGRGLAMQTDAEQDAGGRRRAGARDLARVHPRAGRTHDRYICHQVGAAHRRRLYETLGLELARDHSTFETLGNTGSVALPATLAAAAEAGAIERATRASACSASAAGSTV
jgi:hypothetical protein